MTEEQKNVGDRADQGRSGGILPEERSDREHGGNTAPMPAMSKTGSKGAGKLSEEQFRAEKLYYISLSIAKSMLEKGVINEEVLAIIDTKLLEKYRPVSGILLAGKPLV